MASGTIKLDVLPEHLSDASCLKLANGVQICWGHQTVTTVASDWSEWAGAKRARKTTNIAYPEAFLSGTMPTVIAQVRNGTGNYGDAAVARVVTTISAISTIDLWGNGFVGDYEISYIAIGRWA